MGFEARPEILTLLPRLRVRETTRRATQKGERAEGRDDFVWESAAILPGEEFVAGRGDGNQFGMDWDECERRGQLLDGTEGVADAVDEHCRGLEAREVRGAQLAGAPGRMERVGEQQEAIDQAGFGGGKHGRLAASVRVAAEEDAAGGSAAHGGDGGFEALLITPRAAGRRRPGRARLAKRQIAPKDDPSRVTERAGEGDEERRVRVGSRAVREHERVGGGRAGDFGGEMKEAADRRFIGRIVVKFQDVAHA